MDMKRKKRRQGENDERLKKELDIRREAEKGNEDRGVKGREAIGGALAEKDWKEYGRRNGEETRREEEGKWREWERTEGEEKKGGREQRREMEQREQRISDREGEKEDKGRR
jgi:hypothetical protein